MPNILVFVPCFGNLISKTTFESTHALTQTFFSKGIGGGVAALSFPDIAELRAIALTIFYDGFPDYSHILMVDSDMGFSPQLVLDMLMFDQPVVGCIYPKKTLPIEWVASGLPPEKAQFRSGFVKVEGIGFGVTLIRRDCVRKMLEVMPELSDSAIDHLAAGGILKSYGCKRIIRAFEKLQEPDRGLASEDISFCLRWGRCGGEVWAAGHHEVVHVGPYAFKGAFLSRPASTDGVTETPLAYQPEAPAAA